MQYYVMYPDLLPSVLPLLTHPKLGLDVAYTIIKILSNLTWASEEVVPPPGAFEAAIPTATLRAGHAGACRAVLNH